MAGSDGWQSDSHDTQTPPASSNGRGHSLFHRLSIRIRLVRSGYDEDMRWRDPGPVLHPSASHLRRAATRLLNAISIARSIAGCAMFLILIQSRELPEW